MSPSFCVAAGYSKTAGGLSQPLVETWNGSGWSAASLDAGAGGGVVWAVSCLSVRFCVAGGATGGGQPLLEMWDGSAWSATVLPAASGGGVVRGVSCASDRNCIAVGSGTTSSNPRNQPLAAAWDGTTWSLTTPPSRSATEDEYLLGVSCVSARLCVAAGSYLLNAPWAQPLAEVWDGTAWSLVLLPPTGPRDNNVVQAVSCASTSWCAAVGYKYLFSTGAISGLALTWNGTAWAVSQAPAGDHDLLNGVSCPTGNFCVAVGFPAGLFIPGIETWNGATWSVVGLPPTASGDRDMLNGVSCSSTLFCVAVGNYHSDATGGHERPLIEISSGT